MFNESFAMSDQILNQSKNNTAETNAVDSDEGWSDEDNAPPPPIQKPLSPNRLTAGDRMSSGVVIKKAVSILSLGDHYLFLYLSRVANLPKCLALLPLALLSSLPASMSCLLPEWRTKKR